MTFDKSRKEILSDIYVEDNVTATNKITSAQLETVNLTADSASLKELTVSKRDDQTGGTADIASDTAIGGALDVTGNESVGGTLGVTGDATLNADLSVSGDETIAGTLGVTGATSLDSTLGVTGDTSLGANLSVGGDEDVTGTLNVTGATTMTTLDVSASADIGALTVDADASVGGALTVTGNESVGGNVEVTGTTALGSTLSVAGAATLNDTLDVVGSATLESDLDVQGNADITGTLDVGNNATFDSDISVTGNATVTGTLEVNSTSTLGGNTSVSGELEVSDRITGNNGIGISDDNNALMAFDDQNGLQINRDVTLTGTDSTVTADNLEVDTITSRTSADAVQVDDDLQVTGGLEVGGGASVGADLAVTGLATIGSTLTAADKITGNNGLEINDKNGSNQNIQMSYGANGLAVSGGVSVDTLGASGDTMVGGTLGVTGNTTLGGTLGVTGNTSLSTVSTSGQATLASLSITGNTQLSGNLTTPANKDITLGNQTARNILYVDENKKVKSTIGTDTQVLTTKTENNVTSTYWQTPSADLTTANGTAIASTGGLNALNVAKAPNNHAINGSTYGLGTDTNYGHVRFVEAVNANRDAATSATLTVSERGIVDFVIDSVNNVAAYYITDSQGMPFATHAALMAATTNDLYSGGQQRTPTRNDYTIISQDETQIEYSLYDGYTTFTTTANYIGHYVKTSSTVYTLVTASNKDSLSINPGVTEAYEQIIPSTRYIYTGADGTAYNKDYWSFQYSFNMQFTGPQMAAINSGITAARVSKLDGIEAGAEVNVQADWDQTNTSLDDYIKNKPAVVNAWPANNANLSQKNYPSEKLVKLSLDDKLDDSQLVNSWGTNDANATPTNIPSAELTKTTLDDKVRDVTFDNTNKKIQYQKLPGGSKTDVLTFAGDTAVSVTGSSGTLTISSPNLSLSTTTTHTGDDILTGLSVSNHAITQTKGYKVVKDPNGDASGWSATVSDTNIPSEKLVKDSLDTKQPNITGAATTITSDNLTASRALVSNGSGKVAVSSVTNTELGYVSGVTSAIQTQLDNKLDDSQLVDSFTNHVTDNNYIPSAKLVDDTKVNKTTTVNGHALSSNVTVSKSDVGLGNCDNTSDLDKPISTATQTALDAKVAYKTGTGITYTADHIATFDDTTGKVIKDSGYTIATSVPSGAVFTDANTQQLITNGNYNRPLLMSNYDIGSAVSSTGPTYKYTNIYANPSTGVITATGFAGNLAYTYLTSNPIVFTETQTTINEVD